MDPSRTHAAAWSRAERHPELSQRSTHVWRVRLDATDSVDGQLEVLSADERERVGRFYYPHHARRYAVAHSALRRILAGYESVDPGALRFVAGEHGKPDFAPDGVIRAGSLHFNLSHSGDVALVAVSRDGAVGVDVEKWRTNVQHLEISERFFSPYERDALRAIATSGDLRAVPAATRENGPAIVAGDTVLRGFFSTWSRKEAYLKATGHGISRGLHHFDVTLDELAGAAESVLASALVIRPARLIADRLDSDAPARWVMHHIDVGPGYSGALVSPRPSGGGEGAVALFESPYI